MSKAGSAEALAQFEENAKRPFGMRDKIGYAAGDFANDLTFVIAAMFMMKFYTDVMGVAPAIVGALMMAAKVVDAFTDVAMGQICDRSPYTAKGKFAPWVRRFAGPVAVASFLIFAPYFADKPMGFKIFWMFFTYLLWGSVCYTGVNIPYGSMASAITDDAKQRTELSTWRNIGATVAQIIIVVVLPLVVYTKNDQGQSVLSGPKTMMASAVCSVLAFLVYMVCYHLSTERVKLENKKGEQKNVAQLFGIIFTDRAFLGIIISALFLLLAQLTLSNMMNYIYPNYFNNTAFLSISGLVGCGIVLVLSTFVTKLADRYGKKELASAGALVAAVMQVVAFTIHTHNVVVYIVLYCITYAGMGFFNLLCWAMIIDVIDEIEVRDHLRSDGTVYSVYSFARKLGQAASSGISGVMLTAAGYTAATAFDTAVVNNIYSLSTIVPGILFGCMALSLFFIYPLTRSKVNKNIQTLKERREGKE